MDREVRRYLEGLAGFNVVFMQLVPGTKRTTRTWDRFEEFHAQRGESRIDLANYWLREGFGVGYLLRNRLAAVDADNLETVRRVMDFEERDGYLSFPKVFTPGGGIHALMVHPPCIDLTRLKNHVCHPKEDGEVIPWDFKLGERTMLVAPGTVTAKGTYKPGIWLPPPVIDIRSLAPELEIYRDIKDFLRDTRPLPQRVLAAMTYLQRKAPVSIEGKGGRNALRTVALHLLGYYDLDPSLAFHLLTKTKAGRAQNGARVDYTAWNDRCRNAVGEPYPWSDDDLWRVLEDAVDGAPSYGVHLFETAQERNYARWSAANFIETLTCLPTPNGTIWITADALYRAFLDHYELKPEAFHKSELGLEISFAIDQGRLPFVVRAHTHAGGRIYRGLDLNTLRIAMDIREQRHNGLNAAS